jgi:hypothetical protein
MQVGDWRFVIQTVDTKLKADIENPTLLLRLALTLHDSGKELEARRTAGRRFRPAEIIKGQVAPLDAL